jgi:hypothetical protein
MTPHHRYGTLLECAHCNGLGAIVWDLKYREAGNDGPFVGLFGDFEAQAGITSSDRCILVCTQCDAVAGLVPRHSSELTL